MNLADAKKIRAGDYLMNPNTSTPFEAVRVTDAKESLTGRYVHVRLHAIQGSLSMGGGWVDATLFEFAPSGYKYDRINARYIKSRKDGTVIASLDVWAMKKRWVAGARGDELTASVAA